MKENKFKAWYKSDDKDIDYKYGMSDVFTLNDYPEWESSYSLNKWEELCEILEFIGLQDKNKDDIYNGYILKHNRAGIFLVVFDNASFKLKYLYGSSTVFYINKLRCFDDYAENSFEIIGNKFDNPDLLEEK